MEKIKFFLQQARIFGFPVTALVGNFQVSNIFLLKVFQQFNDCNVYVGWRKLRFDVVVPCQILVFTKKLQHKGISQTAPTFRAAKR
jgi:hypothetical protein